MVLDTRGYLERLSRRFLSVSVCIGICAHSAEKGFEKTFPSHLAGRACAPYTEVVSLPKVQFPLTHPWVRSYFKLCNKAKIKLNK